MRFNTFRKKFEEGKIKDNTAFYFCTSKWDIVLGYRSAENLYQSYAKETYIFRDEKSAAIHILNNLYRLITKEHVRLDDNRLFPAHIDDIVEVVQCVLKNRRGVQNEFQ